MEGLLTLNIFRNNFRFYSLTFSFYSQNLANCVVIGGLQGRKADDILDQYRTFTKLAHGLRPRDFLLEVLRMLARAADVEKITAIPDEYRYHRHSYFSKDKARDLELNYDEVWADRGGVLGAEGMFELPVTMERDPGQIAPKKRSMYRKRYALLEAIETRLVSRLQAVKPALRGQAD